MRHVGPPLTMLAIAIALVAAAPAHASPIAYEGFSMPLAAPFDGGAGFDGPWNRTLLPTAHGYAWSGSTLRVSGLDAGGGSVSGDASITMLGFALRDLGALVSSHPTVFVSFLLEPRGKLNEGSFNGFFGLLLGGRGATGDRFVFVGKPGAGAIEQYVVEEIGGGGQVASGVPAVVGRTALLIVKAELAIGGTDSFTLWVDPPVKGVEPTTGGAVKSDLDLGTLSSVGIYSGGAFAIDEIRIGTSYADVVPSK